MRVPGLNLHNMGIVVLALDLLFVVSTVSIAGYFFDGSGPGSVDVVVQATEVVAVLGVSCFCMGLYSDCYELPDNFLAKVAIAFLTSVSIMLCLAALPAWTGAQARATVVIALAYCAGVMVTRFAAAAAAKRERFCRQILVIGEPALAARLQRLRRAARTTRFTFIAPEAVTTDRAPFDAAGMRRICRAAQVHEIVLPDADRLGPDMAAALLQCRLEGVRVTTLTAFLEKETRKIEPSLAESQRLILTCSARRTRFGRGVKRCMDVVGSLALILFTLPLTVLVAVLIKLDDGGPIFYRQVRLGLGNQPFMLTKFRTMRVEAEGAGRARWASVDDDRVTRIGRYLRRPRIDEIPQLFDILRGRMSLVGPRPEQLPICAQLEAAIPLYGYRHLVPPGLTGWAQINFPYAASIAEAEEKTRYDLYYLKNGSVMLDLVILLHTVRTVLFGQGAR